MAERIFTKENCESLSTICKQISSLLDQNTDGSLMASQLMVLGDRIEDFMEHPIIESSGIK